MAGYCQVDREYCLCDDKALEFIVAWDAATSDYNYPNSATMTAEENESYASAFNDINTYVKEQTMKFVIGENDLAEWDNFVTSIQSLGIETLAAYKQAAYDRYQAR